MEKHMCRHTATYVSSYCYICVLILLYMCPHTATYVLKGVDRQACCARKLCVRILLLLYMCLHTAVYVSSYSYTCVLILLYMCPHTAIHVSSYERTGKLVALANAKDKAKAEQDRMKLEREKLRFLFGL